VSAVPELIASSALVVRMTVMAQATALYGTTARKHSFFRPGVKTRLVLARASRHGRRSSRRQIRRNWNI
jgi:hypothetical protein